DSIIHWYRQKENKTLERILYISGAKVVVDAGFQENRYRAEKVLSRKMCTFTINDVIPDDTATYYCAYWYRHCALYFVHFLPPITYPEKVSSAPMNYEIMQTEHGNQLTYVCLIEKFYPEVIRVKWTDDNKKEVTDKVVKGDAWKAPEGDEYSISSWLTVPAENKDKNYNCEYEHEAKQDSLQTQVITDHLMHRTAYLVYLILLLKSSMYYLIVLFFIYK
ncbi:TCC3 protein, partial [Bucorvus abyssinicus]|nr:TCC3 protein [Bucorvus abyssinicus]